MFRLQGVGVLGVGEATYGDTSGQTINRKWIIEVILPLHDPSSESTRVPSHVFLRVVLGRVSAMFSTVGHNMNPNPNS